MADATLPAAVATYLLRLTTANGGPAYLRLDAAGTVREAGGALATFGLADIALGEPATHRVGALAGLVPPGPEPVTLSMVEDAGSPPADLHLFEDGRDTWVILLNVAREWERLRATQQLQHELSLLRARPERASRPAAPGARPAAPVLARLNIAMLEPVPHGALRLCGEPPPWFLAIWPEAASAAEVRLEERSAFLEHFLVDASDCWAGHGDDTRGSGLWTEVDAYGREWSLRATALRLADQGLLLLEDAASVEAERSALLQAARDRALRHQALQREVEKRDVLLGHVVHDLRAPVTSVASALELLKFEELPPRARQLIDASLAQTGRQEMLIRSVLELFSGDLRGLRRADATPVDVLAAARAVQAMYEPLTVFRRVTIRLAPDDAQASLMVLAHANRLERVLGNLVDNAMRHSPEGGVVTITSAAESGGVRTTVDDQGRGLAADQLPRLFQMGSQGTHRRGLAGLGLHFCRTAVEAWGGTIEAENRPDGGARFTFWLPAPAAQDAPPTTNHQPPTTTTGKD